MSENQRKKTIAEIEKIRNSRVITYVTSNRPNVESDLEESDIIQFRKHLEDICAKCSSVDLFLYSYGGELETAWELVNLIREYNMDFSVLVPYHARSAASLITFGAKEIVMGKMGSLGPIDPTVRIKGGELSGVKVSITDMDAYEDFLRDEYQVTKPEEKIKAFEKLAENVPPILIGKAYKNLLETRKDAMLLLKKYYKDKGRAKKISDYFLKEIRTHNHSISREEARSIGLNVAYAPNPLEVLMWKLFKEYEQTMQMDIPYLDVPPKNSETREIPFTYIESGNIVSKKIGLQKFRKLEYPKGSIPTEIDNTPSIHLPDGTILPVLVGGGLIIHEDNLYEKTEDIYWVTKRNSKKADKKSPQKSSKS